MEYDENIDKALKSLKSIVLDEMNWECIGIYENEFTPSKYVVFRNVIFNHTLSVEVQND